MDNLSLHGSAASFVGKRSENQDNLRFGCTCNFIDQKKPYAEKAIFSTEEPQLFCVCDGVGGEEFGDMASQAALMGVKEYLGSGVCEDTLGDYVLHAAENAQRKVIGMYEQLGMCGGTTLVMIGICGREFVSLNIGDSPLFLYHRKSDVLEELSERHNEAWEAIRQGFDPQENDARSLCRCLGIDYPDFVEQVYMRSGVLEPGDTVMLCSDGVSEAFPEKLLKRKLKWRRKAGAICAVAGRAPHADNCTAICLEVRKG